MCVCRSKCQQWNVHARFILATVCPWIWLKMQGISTLCTSEHSSWCLTFVGSLWFWFNWDTLLNCVFSNLCGCLRIRHCPTKSPKKRKLSSLVSAKFGLQASCMLRRIGGNGSRSFRGGGTLPFSLDVVPHWFCCASWLPPMEVGVGKHHLILPDGRQPMLMLQRIFENKGNWTGMSSASISAEASTIWLQHVVCFEFNGLEGLNMTQYICENMNQRYLGMWKKLKISPHKIRCHPGGDWNPGDHFFVSASGESPLLRLGERGLNGNAEKEEPKQNRQNASESRGQKIHWVFSRKPFSGTVRHSFVAPYWNLSTQVNQLYLKNSTQLGNNLDVVHSCMILVTVTAAPWSHTHKIPSFRSSFWGLGLHLC